MKNELIFQNYKPGTMVRAKFSHASLFFVVGSKPYRYLDVAKNDIVMVLSVRKERTSLGFLWALTFLLLDGNVGELRMRGASDSFSYYFEPVD
jgi:hypothetical protein